MQETMKLILSAKARVKIMSEKDLPSHSKFIMWMLGVLVLALSCRLVGLDVDTVIRLCGE